MLETQVKMLDHRAAAEALLRGYGGEVYSFLCSLLRDESGAEEAFSLFCEDLWVGLPKFRGEASYRTWTYQVARHAAYRARRADERRVKSVSVEEMSGVEAIAAEIRTTTAAFMKADVKDRFRALRELLRPEDRELLLLRLDRELEWSEIAGIVGGDAVVLRKRFERIKEKMKALAEKAGLLG